MDPLTHAQQFVSEAGGFSRPEAVVKAGRHMAATEIAAEPLVRQVVRKQYQVSLKVVVNRGSGLASTIAWMSPLLLSGGVGCARGAGCRGCAADPELQRLASSSFASINRLHAPNPQDNAAVWTTPTAAGETAIDPFHPLARVKRLAAKPLERFEGRCAGCW